MPVSKAPRKERTVKRTLNKQHSRAMLNRFFVQFDFGRLNDQLVAAGEKPIGQCLRTNLKLFADHVMSMCFKYVRKSLRPGESAHITLPTHRTSLANVESQPRHVRSVDRYVDLLIRIGLMTKARTGRGLRLSLLASLFVYLGDGEPLHVPPVPVVAAQEAATAAPAVEEPVVLDAGMQAAIAREQARQRWIATAAANRQKNAESSSPEAFRPPS